MAWPTPAVPFAVAWTCCSPWNTRAAVKKQWVYCCWQLCLVVFYMLWLSCAICVLCCYGRLSMVPSCLQSLQKPIMNVLCPETTNHSGLLLGLTFIRSYCCLAAVSLASVAKATGTLALSFLLKKYTWEARFSYCCPNISIWIRCV